MAEPRTRRRARRRSRWPLAAGIVAAVAVGATVGLLTFLQRGPFRAAGPAAVPTFDVDAYSDDPSRLAIQSAAVSSRSPGTGSDSTRPALAVDGDISTAWVARAGATDDAPTRLVIRLEQPSWIDEVIVWNGDQADPASFDESGRARRVAVSFGTAGPGYEVELDDTTGPQVVELPEPVRTGTVTVTPLAAVGEDPSGRVAFSEVELVGWPAVEDDADG